MILHSDIVVVGGGAAGVGAAVSAAQTGAKVLLLESSGTLGGDMVSGMPILGAYDSTGKQCSAGVLDQLMRLCDEMGGSLGPVCDWRTVYGLCLDPCSVALAVAELLDKSKVAILLNTKVVDANLETRPVIAAVGQDERFEVTSDVVIDATGGGNVVRLAGGQVNEGSSEGEFQPVSLLFRMSGVDYAALLDYVLEHPEDILLSENPVMEVTPQQAAENLHKAGLPYCAISSKGESFSRAIECGDLFPCTAAFVTPTSIARKEVCLNMTRVSGINPCSSLETSSAMLQLSKQVRQASDFLRRTIPGFQNASVSGVAHRVGVRETGRVVGEATLKQEDVLNAVVPTDSVARGSHHVDIHGRGTDQTRIPIKNGASYGIPMGCLIPKGLTNILVAGRCLSSDRGANGSARVMGTCIAMGQAAGTAAAIMCEKEVHDPRQLPLELVQLALKDAGALI